MKNRFCSYWLGWSARKVAGTTVLLIAFALLGSELVARFWLGLGDPPLSIADPDVEYLPKPGTYRRFGNRISINTHHMRSEEWERLSVLVAGDSAINGGSLTDQEELATTLLANWLGVPVGNASADSWGPINLLAYIQKFGLFEAEVVVLVLNGADAADARKFAPIVVGEHPRFPATRPLLALQEVFFRYLPRYLPKLGGAPVRNAPIGGESAAPAETTCAVPEAIAAVTQAIAVSREAGARVVVALHRRLDKNSLQACYEALERTALQAGATVVQLDVPTSAYRDNIHVNAAGQQAIAEQLEPVILQLLQENPP
ncbi:hypothetical protein [Synechococcus sp. PCC 7336]|uniref:hypothetical protein n=1 Tax=Synechococcus sp. PCC 7336 TaxID=195250 RepID=UPI0012E9F7C9|nr:hypothetical protein [Synechococcus sp. PCC 7336]